MSAPAIFRKDSRSLRPACTAAEELLSRIKLGTEVVVEVKRSRNLKHLKKWWSMLQLVSDNLEGISAETLCEVIKLRTGHVTVVKTRKGIVEIPKSISFASLSQTDFEAFYDRAVAFILSDILPGLDRRDLDREIEEILIGRAA